LPAARTTSGNHLQKIRTRELFEVRLDHLRLARRLGKIHPGNKGKVNVRINEAGNQNCPFPETTVAPSGGFAFFFRSNTDDAVVFDQYIALLDVIEVFRGNDSDVRDQDFARRLA
jgi:hypothetical protein